LRRADDHRRHPPAQPPNSRSAHLPTQRMKTNHSGCPDRLSALRQRAPGEDACACRYQQTLPRSRHLYRRAAWMLQNTYVITKPSLRPKIVSLRSS
jgi:hypothetical protein